LSGLHKELTGEDKSKRFRRLLGREYMETDGLADKVRATLNEMAPTTPLTYVSASTIGGNPIH